MKGLTTMSSIIELNQDISEMEEYEPLPDGPYPATIRDVEVKTNEKNPNGYFVITLLVEPENFPADYDPENSPQGVPLTYARVQVPDPKNRRTVKPFKNLLRSLDQTEGGTSFDTDDWTGQEILVMVSTNEYLGTLVNNVDSVGPIPKV